MKEFLRRRADGLASSIAHMTAPQYLPKLASGAFAGATEGVNTRMTAVMTPMTRVEEAQRSITVYPKTILRLSLRLLGLDVVVWTAAGHVWRYWAGLVV